MSWQFKSCMLTSSTVKKQPEETLKEFKTCTKIKHKPKL